MEVSARKEQLKQNKQREKEKIKYLIKNIGEQWPDLIINEELLKNPTTNFVKTVYGRFYSEYEMLTNKVRTEILQQEAIISDQNTLNDERSLTIRLNKICTPLGMNLNDMCEPQPKRTVLFFTLLMNVIIYLKSNTDIIAEVAECVQENENYQEIKATIVSLRDEIKHSKELDIQLEHNINTVHSDIDNLNKEHKEVLSQKTEKDYKYQQDYKLISKIRDEIKIADECLSNLRKESVTLQEQIVSEEEVENLKKEDEQFRNEFDKLDSDRINITSFLEEQEEKIKYYRVCLNSLQCTIFSPENFQRLDAIQEKLKTLHQNVNEVYAERILKESELSNMQSENSSLHQELEELQKELDILSKDTTLKINELKNDLVTLRSKTEEEKVCSISLENEIRLLEEIKSEIIEEINDVTNIFRDRYEKFINHKDKLANEFCEIYEEYISSLSK